ncbi:hypothetical protein DFH07DRAFT_973202 [Mycena maculata]|uniref:Uncharacterized protein n=1 Tax=Mycena maculata TaxID=230809 RepID=A0AAD7MIU7_9AGAR|nr:hypothetical protein DFH07DRAFT_973202 [Mycena maculata]
MSICMQCIFPPAAAARDHVPSLVDLAAERLGNLSLDDEETMDAIPSVILASYMWGWHKIAYPAMRRALQRLPNPESAPEGSSNSIDEWILLNDKWLRDGKQAEWQQGLVTFDDADNVFQNSILADSSRTITRLESLPGYEVSCDAREPHIAIQPSVEAFKRTFDHISDGLLKNLDWSNLFVAGGIILGALLSVDTPDGQPRSDPRWASSDIDMFVYGLSPLAANEKVRHLFETFRANLPPGTPTLVVRNCTTITFYARYPLRRIQIVLKLTESPKSVLLNFDLDVCAMGWDGTSLWMLPRAARALETGCNVFTMSLIRGHYLSNRRASALERVFKYADKGYGLRILPSYMSSLNNRKPSQASPGQQPDGTDDLPPDIPFLIAEARRLTAHDVLRSDENDSNIFEFNMAHSKPSGLSGFSSLMRWVALWEMGRRGEVTIRKGAWALSSYRDAWDERFDTGSFQEHIQQANEKEVWNWVVTDFNRRLVAHGVADEENLDSGEYELWNTFRRTTCAPTVDAVLSKKKDIMLQVLLPCERAQARAGLRETKLLVPVEYGFNFLGSPEPQTDGLFFWRIPAELMWQQLDRSVDELFEVLHAFRKVNEHLRSNSAFQAPRLLRELARRTLYDEFDAFASWFV